MTASPAKTLDRTLQLRNIRICLGSRLILTIDEEVAPGEILTVMGDSGSGKSTLLAFIAGFLAPAFTASGQIRLRGRDIGGLPAHERHTGLLFQDDLLFPHMSVAENLMFAIPAGMSRKERRMQATLALEEVRLGGMGDRDPATLSGGQRARVALMRVLLSQPHALLLDEPFSKLDASLRDDMRHLTFSRARERALPVLLVTHDQGDAEAAGGRVVRIETPSSETSNP